MSARVTALVVLVGLLAAGLLFQSSEDPAVVEDAVRVEAGIAMPASRPEPTLASTWYCAAGTATSDGFGDHVLLIANPTDADRRATITALAGAVAPSPPIDTDTSSTTEAPTTTTTTAPTSTTVEVDPPSRTIDLPAQSRVQFALTELVQSPLAGAVVEIDGGDVAVEHELTGSLGRATAPCSTTVSPSWSFAWGVTERGARDLLVFMNPFPGDVAVNVTFATDEGTRDALRFQGFIVPGRSVVGAYVDEDVTRKAQVSAQVRVRGDGRVIVDRVQSFDGTDGRDGITVALGAPTPAETWMFADGFSGESIAEQVVVFNPTEDVAEVEVEARLDDPETNGTPEPFEVSVAPQRYAIVDLHGEERIPTGVAHSLFVRSLNGVPVVAERVIVATEGAPRRGVSVTPGAPFAAPTWYFPGGGVTDERDEFITILNPSVDEPVTYSVIGLASGRRLEIEGLQDREIEPGRRHSLRLSDHVQREDLPVVVLADGPVVAERGLYRIGGQGIALAMGIPLGEDIAVPDPIDGTLR